MCISVERRHKKPKEILRKIEDLDTRLSDIFDKIKKLL